ncbi:MAG: aminopeptidase, partial [Leptolyngbya sp. DLM2.Bin15]
MAQRIWLDETPPKPFALPGATPHYTPDRPVQVEHIALDLDLDIDAETVVGECSLRLRSRREGVTQLRLDAVDLQIDQVRCNGSAQPYQYDGAVLIVNLTLTSHVDEVLELLIHYRLEQPRRGIYFIKPTPDYPDKPVQVWTQGEDEDSRYWFPCFDYPGQ